MVQHFKITIKCRKIPNEEILYKDKFDNLLAAVVGNYPLLVNNEESKRRKADIEVHNEAVFITIKKGSEDIIDLDNVVDHIRYSIKSICKDPTNCIALMRNHPGPNFEGSIAKMRLADPDNVVLDILADPPIRTNTNLVLWPSEAFPLDLMTEVQTAGLVSIIQQEIGASEDQVDLCHRLLEHMDRMQEYQDKKAKLKERCTKYPEECLKDTIMVYKTCMGTMRGLINAFEACVEKEGLHLNIKIPTVILCLKTYETKIFCEWMEGFKTAYSVIYSPHQYQDSLERTNGLNSITKTNKENILKMIKLNIIEPGDGLYLVRSKPGVGQYGHVAVVTDITLKQVVHAVQNSNFREREYGKIVEDHLEKVVKKKDECFIVRYQQEELTGKDIAYRAKTFANGLPVIKFTYDAVDANCEVVFNAAVGIFEKCHSSFQGRLVKEPFSGRGKKVAGILLEQLQKTPKVGLLDQLYYKLLTFGLLSSYDSRPGRQQVLMNITGAQSVQVLDTAAANPKITKQEEDSNRKCGMDGQEDVQLETSLDMADEITLEDLLITEKELQETGNQQENQMSTPIALTGTARNTSSITKQIENIEHTAPNEIHYNNSIWNMEDAVIGRNQTSSPLAEETNYMMPEEEVDSWAKNHKLNIDKGRNRQLLPLLENFRSTLYLCYTPKSVYNLKIEHWFIKDERSDWKIEFCGNDESFHVNVDCNPAADFKIVEDFKMKEEVKERMKKVCGATNYSLVFRNSEHIARYIYSGVWHSNQTLNPESTIYKTFMKRLGQMKGVNKNNINTFPQELTIAPETIHTIYQDIIDFDFVKFMSIKDELMEKCDQGHNILLIGPTGAGKSSLVNHLYNQKVCPVGSGAMPETRGIQFSQGRYTFCSENINEKMVRDSRLVNIIDTIGLCDNMLEDVEVKELFNDKLMINNIHIDKVLVVCCGRIEKDHIKAIKLFLDLLRFQEFKENFVFINSKYDEENEKEDMGAIFCESEDAQSKSKFITLAFPPDVMESNEDIRDNLEKLKRVALTPPKRRIDSFKAFE